MGVRARVGSLLFVIGFLAQAGAAQSQVPIPKQYQDGKPAGLPLPSSLPLDDYERQLYDFLFSRQYTQLGWAVDRRVRDTGPFILNQNYGTHPAVRIHYSPGVLQWLAKGRPTAGIPDGAMIIKEMFSPPAARYQEMRQKIEAQYPDDPAKAEQVYEAALQASLKAWTVMVKDQSVSKNGWFWANPAPGSSPDGYGPPFSFPASGTALGTCLRCHASAVNETTFSSLANIAGFEDQGDPLQFRVDNSWRTDLAPQERPAGGQGETQLIDDFFFHRPESERGRTPVTTTPLSAPNPDFLAVFSPIVTDPEGKPTTILQPSASHVQSFPGQWADHVPADQGGAQQFITSDNCLGCHGGLGGAPYGVTMFVQTGPAYGDGYNVSEFGEWRWSPMGLAGRDPIFYAQLESEFAILAEDARDGLFPQQDLPQLQQALANTCLSCHGGMGQRQLEIDRVLGVPGVEDPNFYVEYTQLTDPLTLADEQKLKETMVAGHSVYPYRRYGNLARDGISCTLCHHIKAPLQWKEGDSENEKLAKFLMNSTTGVFPLGSRQELSGPFDDVRTLPMESALKITPVGDPYMKDSKLCGTCHTINLPNVDAPTDRPLQGLSAADQEVLNQAARNGARFIKDNFQVDYAEKLVPFQHSIEQATYLEWENSDFAYTDGVQQSCQDCHMPGGLHTLDGDVGIEQLRTQIATIQDSNYPQAEHMASAHELDVPVRDDYRRHEFVGLNVFLVEMFDQFESILGLDQTDYMTGAGNGDEFAIQNMVRQARQDTADIGVEVLSVENGVAEVSVTVTNKVGHRLPSGVGFRRVFLEVLLLDGEGENERVLWGSGRTNSVGVIVGADGSPLDTEFLDHPDPESDIPLYQKHHRVVDSQDQVQIYEELVLNAQKKFTTSFVHRDDHPKDNRLLPVGSINPDTQPEAFRRRFGDSEEIRAFMKATVPEGEAANDPDFVPGGDSTLYRVQLPPGADPKRLKVKATLYSQSIPPYWLRQRFGLAPGQPATQRLYYLTSHLNTQGTPIENWKLPLVTASAKLK
ncbi:MAG TPA: hypothetical protein VLV83_05585 [Acidobacteriota bacterium]|nr:hypothetical protein [Acidobacteriota bacterium]